MASLPPAAVVSAEMCVQGALVPAVLCARFFVMAAIWAVCDAVQDSNIPTLMKLQDSSPTLMELQDSSPTLMELQDSDDLDTGGSVSGCEDQWLYWMYSSFFVLHT